MYLPQLLIGNYRPGHNGNTVIHYAAKMGRLKLVDHLLKMGPLVNLENYLKETPLHLAAGLYTKGK